MNEDAVQYNASEIYDDGTTVDFEFVLHHSLGKSDNIMHP
jgi:hypothetical protein